MNAALTNSVTRLIIAFMSKTLVSEWNHRANQTITEAAAGLVVLSHEIEERVQVVNPRTKESRAALHRLSNDVSELAMMLIKQAELMNGAVRP